MIYDIEVSFSVFPDLTIKTTLLSVFKNFGYSIEICFITVHLKNITSIMYKLILNFLKLFPNKIILTHENPF